MIYDSKNISHFDQAQKISTESKHLKILSLSNGFSTTKLENLNIHNCI